MEGRRDLQETTRLMGEATSVVNELWMWMCGLANSDSFH